LKTLIYNFIRKKETIKISDTTEFHCFIGKQKEKYTVPNQK
jgi:hypothetical protein